MSNEQRFIDLVRMIGRCFYSDLVIVVLDYILDKKKIEEHAMAEDMSLTGNDIRASLHTLEKHNILCSKEGRSMNDELITKAKYDTRKYKYWFFNSDIVRVLAYRLKKMKQALN
jgi:transcription initiation factor IIE alpha subunit